MLHWLKVNLFITVAGWVIAVIVVVILVVAAGVGGVIIGCLVTYHIMKRRASERLTPDDQPKDSLQSHVYEEVSQPKVSEQMFEMGDNAAYGLVRH